jgi:hypothetical protein
MTPSRAARRVPTLNHFQLAQSSASRHRCLSKINSCVRSHAPVNDLPPVPIILADMTFQLPWLSASSSIAFGLVPNPGEANF